VIHSRKTWCTINKKYRIKPQERPDKRQETRHSVPLDESDTSEFKEIDGLLRRRPFED
jgi:hypothetical protein